MREKLGRPSKRVVQNPGDGMAVVRPSQGNLVLYNAAYVEGVHFDLLYTSAAEVGHRCLALALNHLVARGVCPRQASLGVGLCQDHGEVFVSELCSGASMLAKQVPLDLIAEHNFASPSFLVITISLLAEPYPKAKLIPANSIRTGDLLAVTGFPGSSAAGLTLLRRMGRGEADNFPEVRDAHVKPMPKTKAGKALAVSGIANSCIPLHQGLARDLHSWAEAAQCGILLDQKSIPVSPAIERVASFLGSDLSAWQLYGGEDTELLFSVSPKKVSTLTFPFQIVGEYRPKRERVRIHTLNGEVVPLLPMVWTDYARRARGA